MSKILTAYFSASGVTADVAAKVAEVLGSDLYEIKPVVPYTAADLDWMNKDSRSSVEMKDKSSRVGIDGKVEDMASYDAIVIGFPIWWYVAPHIINSFLEQYDLAGKKIAVFATSGSSGMGKTVEELIPSAPGAEFIGEKRLSASADIAEIKAWVDTLGLN